MRKLLKKRRKKRRSKGVLLARKRRNDRLTWGYHAKRRYGIARSGNITYAPLYMTMFLEPMPLPETLTYEIDLSALQMG